jgi:hypothetical protein
VPIYYALPQREGNNVNYSSGAEFLHLIKTLPSGLGEEEIEAIVRQYFNEKLLKNNAAPDAYTKDAITGPAFEMFYQNKLWLKIPELCTELPPAPAAAVEEAVPMQD